MISSAVGQKRPPKNSFVAVDDRRRSAIGVNLYSNHALGSLVNKNMSKANSKVRRSELPIPKLIPTNNNLLHIPQSHGDDKISSGSGHIKSGSQTPARRSSFIVNKQPDFK